MRASTIVVVAIGLASFGCSKKKPGDPGAVQADAAIPSPVGANVTASAGADAGPAAAPQPLTGVAAECARVLMHVNLTIGIERPPTQKDVDDCVAKSNEAQRACMLAATSAQAIAACKAPDAGPPLTPVECERVVAHMEKVANRNLPAEVRGDLVRSCALRITRKALPCVLAATSVAEIASCGGASTTPPGAAPATR